MKRYSIIAGLLFLALAGCSLLDLAPDGRQSLGEIFSDHDKTAAYLNSCYMNIPPKSSGYYWVCNAPTALSDEGYLVYGSLADPIPAKLYLGSASAAVHPLRDNSGAEYYATYMWQIRQCTVFLNNIDGAKVNSEYERNRWRAEARVLRAYFMSEMLKWFGSFAFEAEGYRPDYDYKKLKKRTAWEIAVLIDEECTKAIEADELPWRIENNNEKLRVTKALAWSIKSKMYLFAASPLLSEDFLPEEKKEHWEKAYKVNEEAVAALEANGYALKTDVTDKALYSGEAAAYQELFTSSSLTSADDKETIWQASQNQNYIAHNYIGSLTLRNSTRAGVVPTQELVDAYEVLSADGSSSEPLLNLTTPYNLSKEPVYNPKALALGYDPSEPYKARRDPRMSVCVIKNEDEFYWDGKKVKAQTYIGGDNGINEETAENRFTRTGYYFRKYIAPDADAINMKPSAPWKYFRLAEIKLNLAEAAAEAGHLDVAKTQVDQIRARVGMPSLPSSLSKEEMILRVRNERMVELCYEECRYFDLRRWAESYESSALYKDFKMRCFSLTAMSIKKTEGGVFVYERKTGLYNKSTKPRDLLLPIPENEAQTLYSITGKRWQNSGW